MCKDEVQVCQRHVGKRMWGRGAGTKQGWGMEGQDGCGLLWLASLKLESLKHSRNSLWRTFLLWVYMARETSPHQETFTGGCNGTKGHLCHHHCDQKRGHCMTHLYLVWKCFASGLWLQEQLPKGPLGVDCLMLVLPRLWTQHESWRYLIGEYITPCIWQIQIAFS